MRISNFGSSGIIPLTDATGNKVTLNGVGLYVNNTPALAALLGIDTFEAVIQPETFCTPVAEYGDQLLVGNKLFKRVYHEGTKGDCWIYVATKKFKLFAENMSVVDVNNSSTATKLLGSIKVPGDAMRLSKTSTLTITVTADGDLTDASIYLGFSKIRIGTQYRIEKTIVSGNTATLEVLLTPQSHATKLKAEQVAAETAPTLYPYASQINDVNLLGNVEFPVSFKFATAVSPSTVKLLSATATLQLSPPESFKYDSTKTYRKAYLHPFPSDDMWNLPLTDRVVTGRVGFPLNWATTGSASTGTINASGTTGSDLIFVHDSSKCRVGEYVCFADTYGTSESANTSATVLNAATITALGYGPKIIAIPDSTHIQLDRASLTTWTRRGIEAWGAIHFLASFSSAETLIARSGATAGDMTKNPVTGTQKTGGKAIGYKDYPVVYRLKSTDPIQQWKANKVVTFNGWINKYAGNEAVEPSGEAVLNTYFFHKTPAFLTTNYITSNGSSNADRNVTLISEDGRYAIEHYGAAKNDTTGLFTSWRSQVIDLYSNSVSNLLPRTEFAGSGISDGNRAYGGSYTGGIIRGHELAACPNSAATGESPETIAANIAIAMNAIPHAIAFVLASGQLKSNNYAPNPAVQGTKVNLKAYKSQLDDWKPVISVAGSSYALGDVLYVVGGDYFVPMRLAVTGIDGSGGVTDVFVTQTGQYKTIPSDGSALATTSSGSGTGCVLNVLTIPTAVTQTTTALAFPDIGVVNSLCYPAPSIDGGWSSEYSGTIPMGGLFTINPAYDLVGSWTTRRTSTPTAKSSSYELLAFYAAIQKYGAYCVDITRDTHITAVIEKGVDATNLANLHGDTGSFSYPNLTGIKNVLLYVENNTPQGKGVAGNLKAPMAPDLYPINN